MDDLTTIKTLGDGVDALRASCLSFLELTENPQWGLFTWMGFLANNIRDLNNLSDAVHPEGKDR
jgi:hypothetical protein